MQSSGCLCSNQNFLFLPFYLQAHTLRQCSEVFPSKHQAGDVLCLFFFLHKATVLYIEQCCSQLLHRGNSNNDYSVLPLHASRQINQMPCCQHQESNLQQQPPSSLSCLNLWKHTSCLLCVFTTHSTNYSGTKQLNSMWSHSVHLPCGLRDYPNASALHTPSYGSLTHSTRDCSGHQQTKSQGKHVT